MKQTLLLVSLLASLHSVFGNPDPAPSPAPTPAPDPASVASAASGASKGSAASNKDAKSNGAGKDNYIPGFNCRQGLGGGIGGQFQVYLSAHRGQQQVCPNDPNQNIRYRVDQNQIGCCTDQATLTNAGGQWGCCPCGQQCGGGAPPMQDWYWQNGNQLIITPVVPPGVYPGGYGPGYSTYLPGATCLPGQPCQNYPGNCLPGQPCPSYPGQPYPGQYPPGVYPTATAPLQFQPTSQTVSCFPTQNGPYSNNQCATIYYGPNTATTMYDNGYGNGIGGYGGVGYCQTFYNNGIASQSCSAQGISSYGYCNTFYNGGTATTSCSAGGFGYQPCFTYFNGGQSTVTCTPTTTASTYYTTSTQSFCNTFVNGGATTTSCTTNTYTSATRTSYAIINGAPKETGMVRGVLGQAMAGVIALGVAAL